ncbi:MAG: hypothetical protein SGPRY_012834, partial [Prymnesium sp.]
FALGASVVCRFEDGWRAGKVIRHDYFEESWPDGHSVPYQVELTDGTLIFVPADRDQLVRASQAASAGASRRPTEQELSSLSQALFHLLPAEVQGWSEAERSLWVRRVVYTADVDDDEGAVLDAKEDAAPEVVHRLFRHLVELHYEPFHPALYDPEQLATFVEPALIDAITSGETSRLRDLLLEESRGLFSLQLFTQAFCKDLLEECEHFEA